MTFSSVARKTLKTTLFALLITTVASCSDNDSSSNNSQTPANDGGSVIEGFWVATTVGTQPLQANAIYSVISNETTTGVDVRALILSQTSNCYNSLSERIVRTGDNSFRDGAGDTVSLSVTQNRLTMVIGTGGQIVRITYVPVTGLTPQDIPTCRSSITQKSGETVAGGLTKRLESMTE